MDVDTFDWSWHPDATDPPYIYEFGTQHQRTGGPRYVIPDATEIKYVDQIRIKTQCVATGIIEIDHLDGNAGKIPNTMRTSRYFDNYLDTHCDASPRTLEQITSFSGYVLLSATTLTLISHGILNNGRLACCMFFRQETKNLVIPFLCMCPRSSIEPTLANCWNGMT